MILIWGGYILVIGNMSSGSRSILIIVLMILLLLPTAMSGFSAETAICQTRGSRQISLSSEVMINDNTGASNQANPSFSVYKTWLYSTWQDHRLGDFDIFFSSSSDGGTSWGDGMKDTDIRVNDDLGISAQEHPDIAVNSDGDIFITWQDNRYGNWDIFISISTNGGTSWSSNYALNGTTSWDGDQVRPKIVIDGKDDIYIAYSEEASGKKDVKVIRSVDNGKTFSAGISVSTVRPDTSRGDVDIAVYDGGSVFFTWSESPDSSNSHIYFSKTGPEWPDLIEPVRVDNETQGVLKTRPSIDVSDNNDAYITWLENYNNLYNIYLAKVFSGSSTSTSDVKVNAGDNTVSSETWPELMLNSVGMIYIAWASNDAGYHIELSESQDGGQSFEDRVRVDSTGGLEASQERFSPTLEPSGKDFFIAWEDYRNDPMPSDDIPDNADIFFSSGLGSSNQKPSAITAYAEPLSWDKVKLYWTLSHEPDFYAYIAEISSTDDFEPLDIVHSKQIFERTSTTYTFTGLVPNTRYYFRVSIQDSGGFLVNGPSTSAVTSSNTPPAITIIEPDGISDIANNSYTISWSDSDPDDNATISIYYYHDLLGEKLIVTVPEGEDGELDRYVWDTSRLIEGDYTIKMVINDTYNEPLIRINENPVSVNHHSDIQPPRIISLYPADSEEQASVDTDIRIIFDEEISSLFSENSVTLYSPLSGVISGTQTYDPINLTLIFRPDTKLELDLWYTVSFQSDVKDAHGNSDQLRLTWRFKTTPIEVIFITPVAGSIDVPLYDNIVISFSVTMNRTSVEQTFNIAPSLNNIEFQWSMFNTTLTVSHGGYSPGQNYTLSIGPGISSNSGVVVHDRQQIEFRTVVKNIAPELVDHGYFKVGEKYLFFTEYIDQNGDAPGTAQIHLYRRNAPFKNASMSVMTREVANRIKKYYEPPPALLDGIYYNSELYYYEADLKDGKYRYFFEFTDIHGAPADSDSVPLNIENSAEGPYISTEDNRGLLYLAVALSILLIILITFFIFYLRKKVKPEPDDEPVAEEDQVNRKEEKDNEREKVSIEITKKRRRKSNELRGLKVTGDEGGKSKHTRPASSGTSIKKKRSG